MRQQFPIILDTISDDRRFKARCHVDRRNIVTFVVENETMGGLLAVDITNGPAGWTIVLLQRPQVTALRDWLNSVLTSKEDDK